MELNKKIERINELVSLLNKASDAYYGGEEEVMPNHEWDRLFDELKSLEEETGIVLKESPTQSVSDSANNRKSNKEEHEFPALSLAKTKEVKDLADWADKRDIILSWKLDGLTLVVTYDNGCLTKIVTRGNGHIGTNISYMAGYIQGIPLKIDYKGHMVVRGEAVISNDDFNAINAGLEEPYSNPRNLASGTLNLKQEEVEGDKAWRVRFVRFIAFALVYIKEKNVGMLDCNSFNDRLLLLKNMGFTPVDREIILFDKEKDGLSPESRMEKAVAAWTDKLKKGLCPYPVDGLVICYDDVPYSQTGSITGHHATRGGFAFKWPDTPATTTLRKIEWSCAAHVITPVAVFDPVELEGTKVSRASLANVSEMERLGIGNPGETKLSVIKANMIIPKVIRAERSGDAAKTPSCCPACGMPVRVKESVSGAKTLICTNPDCAAKKLMAFNRFVGKTGLDIDGLSIETLRRFISCGYLTSLCDIFSLEKHAEEISKMDGFGKRSCDKLMKAIEASKKVSAVNFIKSLSIPMIGQDAAKRIFDAIGYDGFIERIGKWESFADIEGIGPEKDASIQKWFNESKNVDVFDTLRNILEIEPHPAKGNETGKYSGMTFVITGDVHRFKNRDELKAYIEAQGGKVAGSVSKKTTYLVNNDVNSTSSKNKKAMELNIPIISEDFFNSDSAE